MPKYRNKAGELCTSKYEVSVTDDLWKRGVEYIWQPGPFCYTSRVLGGFCGECDSNNVRKGRLYTPDLLIVSSGRVVELKGGDVKTPVRGALRDFVRNSEDGILLHFMFRRNTLIRGSKTTLRRWAQNMGCPVHIGMTIPENWL